MPESASGGDLLLGGPFPGGSASGGCLLRGGCLLPRGVSALGEGVCSGGSAPGGVCLSAFWDTTPPVNRMTNRCKNITLAATSLRPVMTTVNISYIDGFNF